MLTDEWVEKCEELKDIYLQAQNNIYSYHENEFLVQRDTFYCQVNRLRNTINKAETVTEIEKKIEKEIEEERKKKRSEEEIERENAEEVEIGVIRRKIIGIEINYCDFNGDLNNIRSNMFTILTTKHITWNYL